jgi:hypothetical protein
LKQHHRFQRAGIKKTTLDKGQRKHLCFWHIPLYFQGEQDNLCGYYAWWMVKQAFLSEPLWEWNIDKYPQPPKATEHELWPGSLGTWAENGCSLLFLKALSKQEGLSCTLESMDSAQSLWSRLSKHVQGRKTAILWLPPSIMNEAGHFVVVCGVVPVKAENREKQGVETFLLIQDPAVGSRSLTFYEYTAPRLDELEKQSAAEKRWKALLFDEQLP